MSFDAILGQEAATGLLKETLAKERIASGYLFFGPDGVGKRTTALEFARAILCANRRVSDACGECPACIRSRAGSHRRRSRTPCTCIAGSPGNGVRCAGCGWSSGC